MLKIFNEKLKQPYIVKNIHKKGGDAGKISHYPPASKEWFNSIYGYNKNTTKSLPSTDKTTLKLTRSYFNLYSRKLEKKIKSRPLRIRFRRLSTNRMLISRAELKHTNDKVIITVYIYNRQKKYFLNKIKTIQTLDLFEKIKNTRGEIIYDPTLIKLQKMKKKCLNICFKVLQQKKIFKQTLNLDNIHSVFLEKQNEDSYLNSYEKKYLKNYLIKYLNKEVLSIYFKQIISLNKSKFNHNYILPLTEIIETIYEKKVDFNLVNLKYLHLNSYILTQTIVTKLRNRKNRLLRVLTAAILPFEVPPIDKLAMFNDIYNKKKIKQNLMINDLLINPYTVFLEKQVMLEQKKNNDILDLILNKIYNSNLLLKDKNDNNNINLRLSQNYENEKKHVTNTVLGYIKHKSATGIRLEGAGRLTRRNIAERAIFKLRYLGNLKNMDSSYKGLSSVIFRGYFKSNLQYTKLKSKIKMGSFGIKGWVSSN